MRKIKVPAEVEIENTIVKEPGKPDRPAVFGLPTLIRNVLVGHQDVLKNDTTTRYFMEIEAKVKGLKAGDNFTLSDEQHEFLAQLARTYQYPPDFKLSVLPLLRAISSAEAVAEAMKAEEQPKVSA